MRKLLPYVILTLVVGIFLFTSEGEGIPLFDWMRDPSGSAARNEVAVARDRLLAQGIYPTTLETPQEPSPEEKARAALLAEQLESVLAATGGGVDGRVFDLDGGPLTGVVITWRPLEGAPVSVATNAEGEFEFSMSAVEGRLEVDPLFWVLLGGETELRARGSTRYDLVVAPRLDVAGRVLDADGAPIEGAEVSVYTPLAAAAGPELKSVELPERFELGATSDENGAFALAGLPQLPFTRLEVYHPRYQRLRRDLPAEPTTSLRLMLQADELAPLQGGEDDDGQGEARGESSGQDQEQRPTGDEGQQGEQPKPQEGGGTGDPPKGEGGSGGGGG